MKGKSLGATLGEVAANRKGERETFGRALVRLMKDRGVTRHDISQRAGVVEATVVMWERDKEAPTRGEFANVCRVIKQLRFYPPPEFLTQKRLNDKLAEVAPVAELDEWGPLSVETEEKKERALPEKYTEERVSLVRQVARAFLDDAASPEERQKRLETLQEELPRGQRRHLGIPSPDGMPPIRPPPKGAKRPLKCPRCQVEVDDLSSHRDRCTKRSERSWESAGWRTCEKGDHHWNVKKPDGGFWRETEVPPKAMVLRSQSCEAHRPYIGMVSRSPAMSGDDAGRKAASEEPGSVCPVFDVRTPPTAPDSGASRGGADFDLVERCLVLADMLWPSGGGHRFVLEPADTGLNRAYSFGNESGQTPPWLASVDSDDLHAKGAGKTPGEALRALSDALREETKVRARAAEDMARLLED